jgi:hypothetical protein
MIKRVNFLEIFRVLNIQDILYVYITYCNNQNDDCLNAYIADQSNRMIEDA